MAAEMPRRYWPNLPEAAAIPALAAAAADRVAAMQARAPDLAPRFAQALAARAQEAALAPEPAAAPAPDVPLAQLRTELAACRRCPLHGPATQAVCGEGPANARVMLVGEQPGDQEDLAGKPFVGPAGQLLDRALAEAGLDRASLYLTNAVKHFKYAPRGRRRIHQKPDAGEVAACRWWLDRELAAVQPRLVVALGATAAGALARRAVSVTRERGPARFGALDGYVTVHPSFLLRLPEARRREAEYVAFVADLRRVGEMVGVRGGGRGG
jgi:DNA polymerase